MGKSLSARVSHLHDIEANWLNLENFIPKIGEIIIYDKDLNNNKPRFKIGDGITEVNSLPFNGDIDLSKYITFTEDYGIIDAGRI